MLQHTASLLTLALLQSGEDSRQELQWKGHQKITVHLQSPSWTVLNYYKRIFGHSEKCNYGKFWAQECGPRWLGRNPGCPAYYLSDLSFSAQFSLFKKDHNKIIDLILLIYIFNLVKYCT